jgi:thioredoxin reductase (NADPH)
MLYDAIIIGKGPAGLSSSLYIARGNLKTLIIGKESVLSKGKLIENYCCSEPTSGEELIKRGVEQAKSFGVEIVEEEVLDVKKEQYFTVTTDKNKYAGKAVIIATGKARTKVSIDNLDKFESKGIHYCVICDGFFYTDMKVGILGYKDYAIHELMEMENITHDITLFTNGNELHISKENMKYLEDHKIKINKKSIKAVEGTQFVEKIVLNDGEEEKIDGLFIAYGSASYLDFARKLGVIIENNDIKVDKDQKTNVEGVFAAGDCTGGLTQVATAVGEGAIAGQQIKAYVKKN